MNRAGRVRALGGARRRKSYTPTVLPRFRRGAFALFALGFTVTMLLGDRSTLPLSLRPSALLGGHEWWTPITALFRAPEGLGMLALLWTLLVQWVVGSRLEGFWGTTRYLIMVLVAGTLPRSGSRCWCRLRLC